ncbi:trypsin Inhibitor like cysteine rich domain protein [Ancylostoma caninum]|uniref:Trypsin Inhibitor like cysteine rich domain protein n=1 Tax=Ancylostoma caninum TaxID=29170 RepID=A0A368GC44_ANCCA|nr:trypsin Inhibitor like cysteine rich domain protein [Ancylostoma caninum]
MCFCQAVRPEEDCQLNERYVECGKCESTCEEPHRVCPYGCLQSRCECVSADGYVRTRHGACILASECLLGQDIRSGEFFNENHDVSTSTQHRYSNGNDPSIRIKDVFNTAAVQPQNFQPAQQWAPPPQQFVQNPTLYRAPSFQQQPALFNIERRAPAVFPGPQQQNWIPQQQQILYVQNPPNRPVYYVQSPPSPSYAQPLQYVSGTPRSGFLRVL